MKQPAKKRFSVGRRVLVGMGMLPGTVKSVADVPTVMAEFVHEVLLDGHEEARKVLGCEIYPVPDLDADLRHAKPPNVSQNIHVQGDNSRVNLNSVDNSVNTSVRSNDQLFVDLRKAADSVVDRTDRENIVARLDELERAQGSNGLIAAYQSFIASAAQYMTIFGPFIPVLTQLLSGMHNT